MKHDTKEKWVDRYLTFITIFFIIILVISLFFFKGATKNTESFQVIVYSIIFGVSIIIADMSPIVYFPDKKNQAEITISLALTLAMAFILPPFYSIVTRAIANIIAEIKKRKDNLSDEWYKILFNTTYLSLVVGITSITFHLIYTYNSPFLTAKNLIALVTGGIVYFLIETITLFTLLWHLNKEKNKETFFKFWIKNIKAAGLELLTLFPLGYLLIYIYTKDFLVSILLIPLLVAIYLASQEKVDIIKQTEDTLYALAKLEDNKFPDTMAHSVRVGNLTELLCKKLKITGKEKEIIVKAAKLHDIGKVSIPDAIINKRGKLSEEEFAKIKEHPVSGANLVSHLVSFKEGDKYIQYHHERWDGKGYPEGKKGEDIPIGSRIICITDSFDAMISNRPYKKAKTIKESLKEIKKEAGHQFDPVIADVFIKTIEELIKNPEIVNNKEEFEKYFPKDAKIE